MNRIIKKYGKDGMYLAGAGIGLGVMSGMDSTGATGTLTGALPAVGGIMAAGMVMESVGYLNKSTKRLNRHRI